MSKKIEIDIEKIKALNELMTVYSQEINALYAIAITWAQLKPEAQDKCADDFDVALVARETLLEELSLLKNDGIKTPIYDLALFQTDQKLLEYSTIVKDLYGFDARAFLNVPPKGLLK